MEGVVTVVYYDGDVVSTYEGVLFECPNGPKFIKISEVMSLVALRKAVTDVVEGAKSLFKVLYRKPYNCMELKDDNEVGNIFKGLIELYAIVGWSPKEILALLRKPR
ncbi:hypothetical protein GmHk_01G000767 [Glycine max]|nr:hypothetical protein GmHk_01G000767 [Glycine max]